MPQFKVKAPDGSIITVDGPEGGTEEQAIAYAQQNYKPAGPSAIKEFGKGLGRGVTGVIGDLGEIATFKGIREDVAGMGATLRGEPPPERSPPYSERMNQSLGLEASPDANTGQKIAGGIGEAVTNPLSWVGGGGALLKAGGAVLGPTVSELAGEAAHEFAPGFEGAARVAGGALGGAAAGKAAQVRGGIKDAAKLKHSDEIKADSQKGYDVLQQDPRLIKPTVTDGLHTTLDTFLDSKGFDDITAPTTFRLMERYLKDRQQPARIVDLVNLHQKLGNVPPGSDYTAAQIARAEVRDFLDKNAPKIGGVHGEALKNWSMHQKIEEFEKAIQVGEHRAAVSGTGANTQNTLRQEVRKILDNDSKMRGVPPEVRQQMEEVVSGTITQNVARWAGRFAPTGLHSSAFALAGSLISAPLTVGIAGTGYAAKKLGDVLTRQQIEGIITKLEEAAPANKGQAALNMRNRARRSSDTITQTARGTVQGVAQGVDTQGAPYDALGNAQP